ncbi:aromatic alcohol reductase [Chitinophaga pendula]|uniref:aromatic alcohol reductase n=1 Tax=Chitinophaga TaxID=79328 RepID=UPI000BAF4A4F|nr:MULTISPECIES: aromatic alcohol reductase [Chitinophaga]ASZ12583.1 aromatic alcohol reductase [Chitinophaga sp. MD30]UCJ09814.1 aromatic alcohol reductase [Chitinophaga pendula]
MKQSFLIIGIGEVGLAMLNSLYNYRQRHAAPISIAVLVQPSTVCSSKVVLEPKFKDIIIEAVDLKNDSIAMLVNVFRKYDTIICCSGFSIGAGIQVKITQAVIAAGVKRYVPWQFGVDYDKIGRGSAQPTFDEQLDVRDLLRAQDQTHWIIVSTGMITSFLFREDFGVISLSESIVHGLGDWQHSLTLTACEDIGALTVAILFHEPGILDQVVFVAGDTLTFADIAHKMEHLFNTKFERVLWSNDYLQDELQRDPDNPFKRYRLVFTEPGVAWPMAGTFNQQHNIPTTDVVQWAKQNILDI